jgi:hypothetical protein
MVGNLNVTQHIIFSKIAKTFHLTRSEEINTKNVNYPTIYQGGAFHKCPIPHQIEKGKFSI